MIGGISGYGTGPPLFYFFKKPQKVLAWGGTEVCQAGFDGLTARRIDWIDGLTAWKTGFVVYRSKKASPKKSKFLDNFL